MYKIARKVALVALSATALTAISHSAQSASVTLLGSELSTGPTPLYDSAVDKNNVVNSPGAPATGSILNDSTGPNIVAGATPWLEQGQVLVNCGLCQYSVQWFFAGSESGNVITFSAPGVVPFAEGNQNNSAYAGAPPLIPGSYQALGTSLGDTSVTGNAIIFSLSWGSGSVDNTGLQDPPAVAGANMIFSYVDIERLLGGGSFLELTRTPGDWFAFALNDNGGPDDNHDDFVGFARVTITGGENPVPIPGALPLFASAIGGGFLFRKLRKRRNAKALA